MLDKTRDAILYAGIAAGLIVTLFGSLDHDGNPSVVASQTGGAIAILNGRPIADGFFRSQALGAREAEDIPETTKRELLNEFLAEQIVIDRAIDVGLVQKDPRVRSAILDAMREFAITDEMIATPSDDELFSLYEATKVEYAPPTRYQLRYQVVPHDSADFEGDILGNVSASRFLPAGILRRSIGDDAANALPLMPVGATREFPHVDGRLFVRLEEKRTGSVPDFKSVRSRIIEDWYRLEEEKQYQAYLQKLIQDADIQYVSEVER